MGVCSHGPNILENNYSPGHVTTTYEQANEREGEREGERERERESYLRKINYLLYFLSILPISSAHLIIVTVNSRHKYNTEKVKRSISFKAIN